MDVESAEFKVKGSFAIIVAVLVCGILLGVNL